MGHKHNNTSRKIMKRTSLPCRAPSRIVWTSNPIVGAWRDNVSGAAAPANAALTPSQKHLIIVDFPCKRECQESSCSGRWRVQCTEAQTHRLGSTKHSYFHQKPRLGNGRLHKNIGRWRDSSRSCTCGTGSEQATSPKRHAKRTLNASGCCLGLSLHPMQYFIRIKSVLKHKTYIKQRQERVHSKTQTTKRLCNNKSSLCQV